MKRNLNIEGRVYIAETVAGGLTTIVRVVDNVAALAVVYGAERLAAVAIPEQTTLRPVELEPLLQQLLLDLLGHPSTFGVPSAVIRAPASAAWGPVQT